EHHSRRGEVVTLPALPRPPRPAAWFGSHRRVLQARAGGWFGSAEPARPGAAFRRAGSLLSLFAATLVLFGPARAWPDRFVVSKPGDVEDVALLDGEFGGWNFGGSPLLEAGFMGGIYAEHRAVSLLRFDLAGIPCAKVTAATLRLYKPRCFVQSGPVVVRVHEIARANGGWSEGTAFCAEDPGGASWVRARIGRPWAGGPGCRAGGTELGAGLLDSRTAPADSGEWLEFALPAEVVQRWLDRPDQNAGVCVRAEAPGPEWGQHVYFHSSEHYSGKGPQLVIEGTAGIPRRGAAETGRVKTPWVLPPAGPAFEQWLQAGGRLARMTRACRMNPEQARQFYFFDTQVREELVLGRYQRPLARIFTAMRESIARKDEAAVRLKLQEARAALLAWEYIRETSWYTAGPLADLLSPWQLGTLFGKSIFGRLEEYYDEAAQGRQRESGGGPAAAAGTWRALSGERLEAKVERTLRGAAQKLGLSPAQLEAIGGMLAGYEREENRRVAAFREHLDTARTLSDQGCDDSNMMSAVRGMHLHHERYLYYQSIYSTPRWSLFGECAPVIPWGQWVAEVGKRYYPKARPARVGRVADQVRRKTADLLPAAAVASCNSHPLAAKLEAFLARQETCQDFQNTGLTAEDYLRLINGQVAVFRRCQNREGVIIDPVMKIEWQYSTPCYALAVALLHTTGWNLDPGLLESGARAMDAAVNAMHEYRCAHNHGEFYLQPVMLALDLYALVLPRQQIEAWRRKIAPIDPFRLHPDNLQRRKTVYNHNVVALAGEFLREKAGLAAPTNFFEPHLAHQRRYLTDLGMYQDPNVPMVYDEFSRQFLASILGEGYQGPSRDFYRDRLWRGAWMSLLMQSPSGECPTGGRSAQHIWNEAQTAVTCELFAAQYARHAAAPRALAKAGAFKRAAHLALGGIERWLRPDGSGFVVKNRYPIEARHGYERYSAQSQYNLLACWLLAVAYLYSDDTIPERPAPADLGGFVVPLTAD
ncbi:MAG TPA: DNRLRE domain-containing protein, partial [Candidatus Paceibacterota bacterium]|nr:DNRLRE domain-containing protein [Candidatus Paceibacterota bacterium]